MGCSSQTHSNRTLSLLKCLDLVFPKWMVFSFLQLHLPPNLNREPYQVSATGTARWRGTVPMASLPEALHSPTPTATNPGESAASMVISPTTSPAKMRCRRLTENGTSTKRESHLPLRSCSTTTTRDSPARAQCRLRSRRTRCWKRNDV